MVKIGLRIKASLENIEELKTCGKDFSWCLKFTCTNCGETSGKWHDVSMSEEIAEPHNKSVCNFASKCKMCSRTNSATILKDSIVCYGASDEGNFKTVVAFDCRGLEPTDFWPRDGWVARATDNGETFSQVDLKDGDWADYCEKTNQPVAISEVQHEFVRLK